MPISAASSAVSLERLRRVLQPIASATGLPNEAYTSAGHFEHERDVVLGRTRAGLAFADTMPDKPYAKPVEFMGLPLLLTRDRAGVLRVFHNVCSHRGMRLVQEPSEVQGLIRCPYHSWTYEPAGHLKGTPHVGGVNQHKCEGFDPARHGLKPVRSAIFMGIIFVNLSGDAAAFEQHIAPLRRRAERFIGPRRLVAPARRHRLATDDGSEVQLELALENYCEAYHLDSRAATWEAWRVVCSEDVFAVEGMQRGRASPAYGGGVFSQVMDRPTHHFHRWVAGRLAAQAAAADR